MERRWRPEWPCPVGQVLRQHRRGGGDPTYRIDAGGGHWRGIRTPIGPATLHVRALPRGERQLVLVTCAPPFDTLHGGYRNLVVVVAAPTGPASARP